MATHRISIFGSMLRPDDSGEAWFEPSNASFASAGTVKAMVLALGNAAAAQPTVKCGAYGRFRVPKNYVSSPLIVIDWSATLTSGNVVFDFDYFTTAGNDSESLDPAAFQESVTVTDAAPATARRKLQVVTPALTAANFTVDDLVDFALSRDGADANDTLAGRAYVFSAAFEYSDV